MTTALIIGDVQAGVVEVLFPGGGAVLAPLEAVLPETRSKGATVIYVRAALRVDRAEVPAQNLNIAWGQGAVWFVGDSCRASRFNTTSIVRSAEHQRDSRGVVVGADGCARTRTGEPSYDRSRRRRVRSHQRLPGLRSRRREPAQGLRPRAGS
jgi:hypothetical protein